jgi:PAS domain S-box-containing protein
VQAEYETVWRNLEGRPIEALIDLPLMRDPEMQAVTRLLCALSNSAYVTDRNLFCLELCRTLNLGMQHGVNGDFAHACGYLGFSLGPAFQRYPEGFRLARLGCDLVEKHGFAAYRAKVQDATGIAAIWTQPVATAIEFIQMSIRTAMEAGDLTYACYAMYHSVILMLVRNDPLDAVWRESEVAVDFVHKSKFRDMEDIIVPQQRFIAAMQGRTAALSTFGDAQFDEAAFEAQLLAGDRMPTMICWYWITKAKARFLAGDHAEALAAVDKATALLWSSTGHFPLIDYYYYAALTVAALYENASAVERPRWGELLELRDQLREWADVNRPSFGDKHALVSAEIARLEGRDADAMRLYEQAIQSAREHGFIQNEGVAHELAARFYLSRGSTTAACAHLEDARRCFALWGADGKVHQLDQLYPHLRREEPAVAPNGTIGTPVEQLDLATVINVSQVISGEIVLEKLLDTLMRTAIELAGAERGLLILSRGAEQRIAAEATTSADTVLVQLRDEPVSATVLPESVLHYVLRTRESVILDDAAAQPSFAADPYIRQHQARSILCLPLLNQARLIGVLYLENNLVPRVFAPARIAVLKLLASQAAISLENTRLYRDLAEREAKIRRLVEANIIGIFLWDFDGRILEANDAFLRMLGYDHEDLVAGRIRWTDLTPPDWHERDEQWVEEHRRTGLRPPIEKEFFRKDGSRVPILLGAATFEEGGNQGVAFVLDLTDRKRAQVELRESEQNYRMLFESIDEGFCTIELLFDRNEEPVDYTFLQVNPSFERQTGIKNAVGRRMREIAPQHEEHWFEIYGRIALTGEPMRFENEAKQLGRWYDVFAYPVEDPKRRRVGILFHDITDRKRAEDAARRSEKELREVIETVPAMVWTALPDGRVDFINRRWQEFTGLCRDETFGWNWADEAPFHPDDVEQYMRNWNASLATGKSFEAEMRIRRVADGEYRWLFESAVPVRDEQGTILKWYGFVVDIEDRKRAEEVLHKTQLELAHVTRLTTLGELTASIAHEVNQPLTAIVTNGEVGLRWLDREVPDLAEVRDALGDVVSNGRRASEIIQRLRALSRKTGTQKAALDINDAISEVIPLVQQEVLSHRVSLRLDLAPTLPAVLGDRVQLQQVIINLVVNGMEAMAPVTDRPRKLVVSSQLDDSGDVLVAVEDSGLGIDPENANKLFNAFFTTKPSGMGMGLSICRSIIEDHGGRLRASRNAGPGATFQFTLRSQPEARP